MKLSFGMIFSIILIVIFIAFAIYGVKRFLGMQDTVQVEKFKADLQNDIDKIWKANQGSQEREYFVPKKIYEVCFVDDEGGNLK